MNFSGSEGDQNLADLLRAEGHDVVLLNFPRYLRLSDASLMHIDAIEDTNEDMIIDEADFPEGSTLIDGGVDFMERNAMLLVDLINQLNTDKVGNEELVIIGPSMGGIVSKYALNYMESEGLAHETRLYISFDAPHLGANIPLGFQHQFNYLAYGLSNGLEVQMLQPVIDNLFKSPAARQLLTDHFESHLLASSNANFDPTKLLPEAHPFKAIFDADINNLTSTGFPENTRNIAIINGSGIGNPYLAIDDTAVTPGFAALTIEDLSLPDVPPVTNVTANVSINLTPATSEGISVISSINVDGFFILPLSLIDVEVMAQAPAYTDGIDAAPGGLFSISAFTDAAGAEGVFGAFTNNLSIDKFSYVPSVSAMAIDFPNDEVNWYTSIDFEDTNTSTPFVNWYLPIENENHLQLTQDNVFFALEEIFEGALSSPNYKNAYAIKIAPHPIGDDLIIYSKNVFNSVSVIITDMTGKIIFKTEYDTLLKQQSIPLNLQSGVYIFNMSDGKSFNYHQKILKR